MKRTKLKKCKILADKGYPDYAFMDIAKKNQNNFISPPKEYKGKCRHNNNIRQRKRSNFETNKMIYKRRVIVESVISVLKRAYDMKVRSRLAFMKKREVSWNILLYNIDRNLILEGNTNCPKDIRLQAFFIVISIFY
jgi:hypothetical protein